MNQDKRLLRNVRQQVRYWEGRVEALKGKHQHKYNRAFATLQELYQYQEELEDEQRQVEKKGRK